ncbi:MAG: hypothetical protein FJ100_04095 [Deltaproteobacteria bacterium]|nr:hypothetical protein [Deltaproteobacteria bacterium]
MRTAAALLACVASVSGCAVNLSEARPARVLRGGELQISEINNVVAPLGALDDTITSAEALVQAARDKSLTQAQARDLAGRAVAIALAGPGYGAHIDVTLGLGYRIDTNFRFGNGIYALSLRRGVDWDRWHAGFGLRAGYNTGTSVIPYLNDLNSYVEIADTTRWDLQAFAQLGREFREWGRLWLGVKAMRSLFTLTVDASEIGLGRDVIDDGMDYFGGHIGFAVGYRYVYFVGELSVLRASGSIAAFGAERSLEGTTVAPSWGILGHW